MVARGWSLTDEDPGRAKRLAIGYAIGVGLVALAGVAGATVRATELVEESVEEILDVKLVPSVAEAPPPPPPPQPQEAPQPTPPGPTPRKAIVAPTTVPADKPPESDKPLDLSRRDEYADGMGGVIGGVAGGTGVGLAVVLPTPTPPPPPPPPPARPAGPIALTEDMTPAKPISTPRPAYPAAARSDGVQATIVVKFVITDAGHVSHVVIVRGHPLFDAAVIAAVSAWRYEPALADGRPVSVSKTVRIPFTIKM